jgi:hypothetical protein
MMLKAIACIEGVGGGVTYNTSNLTSMSLENHFFVLGFSGCLNLLKVERSVLEGILQGKEFGVRNSLARRELNVER